MGEQGDVLTGHLTPEVHTEAGHLTEVSVWILLPQLTHLVTLGPAAWTGHHQTRGLTSGVRDRGLEEGLQRLQRGHHDQEGEDAEVSVHLVDALKACRVSTEDISKTPMINSIFCVTAMLLYQESNPHIEFGVESYGISELRTEGSKTPLQTGN